jgi:hypothetical protein
MIFSCSNSNQVPQTSTSAVKLTTEQAKDPPESITDTVLWMMEQPRCKKNGSGDLSTVMRAILAKRIDRILLLQGGDRHTQEGFLFIMCKESSYRSRVTSPAGAKGIAQLMFDTAQMEADRLKLGKLTTEDLFDDEISITLGYSHFKFLVEKYNGNLARASAAYNGGPNGTTVRNMMQGGGRGAHETDDYVASMYDMSEERRIAKEKKKKEEQVKVESPEVKTESKVEETPKVETKVETTK